MNGDRALFNPLGVDFSYEWLDDDNAAHTLTIPSLETAYFPQSQYEFMKKHLKDEIILYRDLDPVKERVAIEKIDLEIEVLKRNDDNTK